MANVVGKVKSEGGAVVTFVKSHPVAAVVFGMLFGAFLFPMLSSMLGKLKAKGGLWDKVIPGKLTSGVN